MHLIDRVPLDQGAMPRITGDGYMVAMPRVARTGIQLYRGSEVGMPSMSMVRVYRPPEEVFHKDSTPTYAHRPITNDHPSGPVNSANWKDFAVGNSGGDVMRDGEFMRVSVLVMDGKTIKDVEDGKAELSVGYSTELKWEKGTTPQGEAFDAMQTAIRVNHIAIVDAARGGEKLKIGDNTASDLHSTPDAAGRSNDGERSMNDKTTQLTILSVDGIPCTMDSMVAGIVQRTMDTLTEKLNTSTADVTRLTTQVAADKATFDKAIAEAATKHKTELDAANAKIATLEKQVTDASLTPDKLEKLVKDRTDMLHKARAVLGDKLVTEGKSDDDIRAQVVASVMGDTAKGWTPEQNKISFDTITNNVKAAAVTDVNRAFQRPANMGGTAPAWDPAAREVAYAKRDQKLQDAWKQPAGGTA